MLNGKLAEAAQLYCESVRAQIVEKRCFQTLGYRVNDLLGFLFRRQF